jgi:hypothetical protein
METLEIDGAFIGGFRWEQDSELVAVFFASSAESVGDIEAMKP